MTLSTQLWLQTKRENLCIIINKNEIIYSYYHLFMSYRPLWEYLLRVKNLCDIISNKLWALRMSSTSGNCMSIYVTMLMFDWACVRVRACVCARACVRACVRVHVLIWFIHLIQTQKYICINDSPPIPMASLSAILNDKMKKFKIKSYIHSNKF